MYVCMYVVCTCGEESGSSSSSFKSSPGLGGCAICNSTGWKHAEDFGAFLGLFGPTTTDLRPQGSYFLLRPGDFKVLIY